MKRVDYQEIPPRVDYSLTRFGQTLARALALLCEWGSTHMTDVEGVAARRAKPRARAGNA